MRLAVRIGGILVGVGVAIQLALMIVSLIARIDLLNAGSLAGDAGFFAAFLGLALLPLALLLVLLASIGRLVARPDSAFFTRAIGAAIAMTVIVVGLLLGNIGALGGGIIPH